MQRMKKIGLNVVVVEQGCHFANVIHWFGFVFIYMPDKIFC